MYDQVTFLARVWRDALSPDASESHDSMDLPSFLTWVDSLAEAELLEYLAGLAQASLDGFPEASAKVDALFWWRCILDVDGLPPFDRASINPNCVYFSVQAQALILTAAFPAEYAEPPKLHPITEMRIADDPDFAKQIDDEIIQVNPRTRAHMFAVRAARGDSLRWAGLDHLPPRQMQPSVGDEQADQIDGHSSRLVNGSDAPMVRYRVHGQSAEDPLAWLKAELIDRQPQATFDFAENDTPRRQLIAREAWYAALYESFFRNI
jgi:hypothetical protein